MKKLFTITLLVLITLLLVYLLGPQPTNPVYNKQMPNVPNLGALPNYVATQEQKHKIKPNNQAEIVWADSTKKQQTDYAIVYLHGFSASKTEGNPVFYHLAKTLNANMYLARLADHGIDTLAPMQYFTADKLWETGKLAYAIGKKLGKKVILVGTSTGGTLALQLAASYPEVNGLILLSPNVAINDSKAWLLNNPWGLQIARQVIGGNERILTGKTTAYKKYWYTNYRLESVVQLQEFVESTMQKSLFAKVKQPVLLLYYYKNSKEQDPVVRVDAMLTMFNQLGTVAPLKQKIALPNVGNHVMGSYVTSKDILSVQKAIDNFVVAKFKSN